MTTEEERPLLDDPVIRRLRQAFAHEEPVTDLPEVLRRAADYLAVEHQAAVPQSATGHVLTAADLVAARQREPAAVTRLYTAYAPSLYRFFAAAVGNRQEAQDLTGSVFVSAIEGLPGFRGPVEALGGWLFRIARHDLYDFRRKQARSPGLTPLDDHLDEAAIAAGAADPEELAIERLEGSRVMAALQQLSPDQREVLLLRMAAGLTAPEVAAALHKTTGAVKALQHRGLASLARVLGLRSPHDPSDPPYPSLDPARLNTREEERER
jgi:RNA polymerase sigma-70 factor (ECF subfamily)